jgi:predicted transcriptional regulator
MNNYDLDDLSTPGHIQVDKLPRGLHELYTSDNVFAKDVDTMVELNEVVNDIKNDYFKKLQDESDKEILSNLSSDNMTTITNNNITREDVLKTIDIIKAKKTKHEYGGFTIDRISIDEVVSILEDNLLK